MQALLQDKYWVGGGGDGSFMKARPRVVGGTGISNFFNSAFASIFGTTDYQSVAKEYNALVDQYDATLKRAEDYKEDYVNRLAAFSSTTTTTTQPPPGNAGPLSPTPTAGTKKTFDTDIKALSTYNSQFFKLQQERRKTAEKMRQKESNDFVAGEIMNAIKTARESGEARVEVQEKLFAEEIFKRKEFLIEETKLEILNSRETLKQKQKDEITALQNEHAEKMKKIPQHKKKERALLNKNAMERLDELKSQQELEREDFKQSLALKKENLELTLSGLDDTMKDQVNQFNDAIFEALNEFAEEGNAVAEETANITADIVSKNIQTINELIKMSADFFVEQSNRKIAQIDKEINKAEEQYDMFKQLAIEGNIDAKDSLAEQQKIIDQKNRERIKQEKIQARIRLTESVLTTYSQNLAGSTPQKALGATIKDTTLLMQFINSLPAFAEGTEDTGKNGRGVDNKGGFLSVLHPNERVIPKSLNEKIGSLSNEELTRIAINYQNSRVLESHETNNSSLDFAILVNGINDLKEVVKNKPESNIELGEITSSIMEVVKSTKKGNSVVYNRFKIRK